LEGQLDKHKKKINQKILRFVIVYVMVVVLLSKTFLQIGYATSVDGKNCNDQTTQD